MPRVVIDGRMLYQEQCHGVARVVIEMVRRFPPESRESVTLLLANDRSSKFDLRPLTEVTAVEYCDSDVAKPYDLASLWRVLARLEADVLYSPYHALAPLKLPCRLVVGLHDCILETDPRLAGGRLKLAAYRLNTERVLRQATALVVPSEATKATLPTFYAKVPEVHVAPNGVDTEGWICDEGERDALRSKFGLPIRFVLNVGSRRPHKNQEVLVRALAHLEPDVGLVIVGDDDPRVPDRLVEVARGLGVADRFFEIRQVSDRDLKVLYAAATVFAFPSIVEGFGLPPLEAMSAGTPVVASAAAVLAEVCRDAALYVSPHTVEHWVDALAHLLESAELRGKLSERGKAVAKLSTWDRGAAHLYEVLHDVSRRNVA